MAKRTRKKAGQSFSSFEDCRRKFMKSGSSKELAGQKCAFIFSDGKRGKNPAKKKGGLR